MYKLILFFLTFTLVSVCIAQKQLNYKTPPKEITELLNSTTITPTISISPKSNWLLQLGVKDIPNINQLSRPELRLGGVRINPTNFSQSRAIYSDSLVLTDVSNGKDFTVSELPETQNLRHFSWSPNEKYVAFTNTTQQGVELWLLDVTKKQASKLTEPILNNSLPINPFIWIDEGEWIIFTAIPKNQTTPPVKPAVSSGPVIRESKGKKAAISNHQDLLVDKFDIKLFEFYTKSQLTKISIHKEMYEVGNPAIFKDFTISPDGRFILVKMIQKPFSYIVPYNNFPFKVEIWDNDGNLFRELFKIPAAENIPFGKDAVRKGPRNIAWRTDVPSSVYWVWAQDGGDPNRKAVTRDRLYLFDAPFDGEGYESIVFQNRFKNISWGTDNIAIAYEKWWKTRTMKVSSFTPAKPNNKKETLYEYNWQDEYNDPGIFMTQKNASGHDVLLFGNKNTELFLVGNGATPNGYKPFIDKFIIAAKETQRLWQSNDPYYEYPICNIDLNSNLILTKRESKTDFPNYFSRNLNNGVVSQITNFHTPYPSLNTVKSQLLKYKNNDSILLSANLYLPPGYTVGDGLLPVIVSVNTEKHLNKLSANQLKDSPNRFIKIDTELPMLWLTLGYAVLNNVKLPIIENKDYKDSYIEQLIKNTEATINCLDSIAIADKSKIIVFGKGAAATTAANILAHTNLFTTGILQSGAYNHTITPFAYSNEEKIYWSKSESYIQNSPFTNANKITEPILLFHGDSDTNTLTNAIQSELFFKSLSGNGNNSRLVIFPYEGHYFRAKESIMHKHWEINSWLNKYVKNKASN